MSGFEVPSIGTTVRKEPNGNLSIASPLVGFARSSHYPAQTTWKISTLLEVLRLHHEAGINVTSDAYANGFINAADDIIYEAGGLIMELAMANRAHKDGADTDQCDQAKDKWITEALSVLGESHIRQGVDINLLPYKAGFYLAYKELCHPDDQRVTEKQTTTEIMNAHP